MDLEQIISLANFKEIESIPQEFNNSNLLSKGILEEDLSNLIVDGTLEIPKSDKANSTYAFNNFGEGLKISLNYGSQNKDYVSVIIYDGSNLEQKSGHKKEYIQSYPQFARPHKISENPFVLRTNGSLDFDKIRFLLIRKKGETQIYRRGVESNPDIKKISESKLNPNSNLIFGEYHFKEEDQYLQKEFILDSPNLDFIISEVLGDYSIESKSDVSRLIKNPQFDRKLKSGFSTKFGGYNTSKSYLIDWFNEFQIPIIGIGNFPKQLNPQIQELYDSNNQTLSLIGRSHIEEVEKMSKNFQTYLPSYDLTSNLN